MKRTIFFLNTVFIVFCSQALFAHSVPGMGGGFSSGFFHPLFGADHVVAMVAVGILGAFMGNRALWLLPVVFPIAMVFGGVLGFGGVDIPAVEPGIALSAVVIGGMVALAVRLPLLATVCIVGLFAIFHGHAHGTELPGSANPFLYSLGFVLATILLHLSGIAFGLVARISAGRVVVRTGGGAIALIGFAFLFGVL